MFGRKQISHAVLEKTDEARKYASWMAELQRNEYANTSYQMDVYEDEEGIHMVETICDDLEYEECNKRNFEKVLELFEKNGDATITKEGNRYIIRFKNE